ncbi:MULTISPECIES: hypothetical protein [unclassified Roseovarius]|uniref:hypothetical protein n=1 Tax=unclassified Roseovarius TaxID=2614913 RepID=UPI00273FA55F|nr:hypothetical protein [Roseovarius sp. MMSF_3350]
MQTRPDHIEMSRHARLFELLRQENAARRVRDSATARQVADGNAAMAFRDLAEMSFEARPVAL